MSLQFSDTSTKQGLIQTIEQSLFGDNGYRQISGNTDRLYNFTNRINRSLDDIAQLIEQADGRWQSDDSNFTDHPIATTTLVNNQQDYTFATDHIQVLRLEVLNVDGDYELLTPIDQKDIKMALTEFESASGKPKYYDKVGNSFFLYPKPATGSVTMAQGLKLHYKRPPSYFVYTDTTKAPGIPPIFHELVALNAALGYALDRTLSNAKGLAERVVIGKSMITEFYAKRSKDEKPIIRNKSRTTSYN